MAVMVTGGSGFVGANVLVMLGQTGVDAVNFDLVPPSPAVESELTAFKQRIKFVKGSFLDLSRMIHVVRRHNVDKIIHLARYSSGPSSLHEPAMVGYDVQGMLNILELARLQDSASLVFTSSQMVYGPKQYEPVDEDHPKNPVEPYGSQKLMCEHLGLNYHELYGLNFKAVRFTNPYGRFRYGGGMDLRGGDWVHVLVGNAIRGIPTRSPSGGDFAADFFDVRDAVEGVILALNAGRTSHQIFNICSGKITGVKEIIKIVKQLVPEAVMEIGPGHDATEFGSFPSIQSKAKQIWSIPYSIERARKELGYEPKYPIAKGLRDYYEWRLNQESSIRNR